MAKLVWALLCQRVLLDQPTNLVSYIDALDAVSLLKFPVRAPVLAVSTLWQRGSETVLEMRVRVYSPAGTQLLEAMAAPLEFAPKHRRGRMSVMLGGFEIEGPGRFEFGIATRDAGKWVEVHRVPFDVEQAEPPTSVRAAGSKKARVRAAG